jgi:hypothetical protein
MVSIIQIYAFLWEMPIFAEQATIGMIIMAKKSVKRSELLERVKAMEEAFDRTTAVTGALEEALDAYEENKETVDRLRSYMDSGLWQKDFEADEAGLLPDGLKRGVLSEDGLYDLLEDCDALLCRIIAIGNQESI